MEEEEKVREKYVRNLRFEIDSLIYSSSGIFKQFNEKTGFLECMITGLPCSLVKQEFLGSDKLKSWKTVWDCRECNFVRFFNKEDLILITQIKSKKKGGF